MTSFIRKYIGTIVASIGFVLIVIITFGDIGELLTEQYWENVGGNLSSIGAISIGLVFVQVTIKQGISEQALSNGLNTANTENKYKEHKEILKRNREKSIYLPYFLQVRNKRETKRKKEEFIIDNNFTNERALLNSGNKKLIKQYNNIRVNITADSLKWATTEIVYTKTGRIEKLSEYRKRRGIKAVITGFIMMVGTAFITGGLFLDTYDIPFWQKMVKLLSYIIVMAISAIFDVGKNYEKGAFGVPNELDEVNNIWAEFEAWEVPEWVIKEVESEWDKAKEKNIVEVKMEDLVKEPQVILLGYSERKEETSSERREEQFDSRTDLQREPKESEVA